MEGLRMWPDTQAQNRMVAGADRLIERFAAIPMAWLCNVTHTVFGEHPKDIYIHSIAG